LKFYEGVKKMITFDEFKKMELIAGKIVAVDDHPNAQKLYVLKVDVGGGIVKQLVAGLRQSYTNEALFNKQIVVVNNLEPAVLRGVQSDGMLLAADVPNQVTLVTIEKEVPCGTVIR
jgi:methionyl-tRNA synthetase